MENKVGKGAEMLRQAVLETHWEGYRGYSAYSPARIPLPPHIHHPLIQSYHRELSRQASLLC